MFFFFKFISYIASYIGPIQTGFLMTFRKSYSGTGIVFPVKKNITGVEQTRIRKVPAGITNLVESDAVDTTFLPMFTFLIHNIKDGQGSDYGFDFIDIIDECPRTN